MRKWSFILVFMVVQNCLAQGKTILYLIRHAEKADQSTDPELSPAGIARAAKWTAYFEKTPIDKFYSTNYKRTQQTCTPIAASKKKEVQVYKPEELGLQKLIGDHPGKTIVIVGHSNSIPKHINQLLGNATYETIPDSEFGRLYIVTSNNGKITTELIQL
ncbi:MAG TPA: phosphoglycerate mutase family protein [Flavobacterium sp.]